MASKAAGPRKGCPRRPAAEAAPAVSAVEQPSGDLAEPRLVRLGLGEVGLRQFVLAALACEAERRGRLDAKPALPRDRLGRPARALQVQGERQERWRSAGRLDVAEDHRLSRAFPQQLSRLAP